MDHSLRGYLERRSTGELDAILNYLANNSDYAPEVAVLKEREQDIEPKSLPEVRSSWDRYLEKIRQQQNSTGTKNDPE